MKRLIDWFAESQSISSKMLMLLFQSKPNLNISSFVNTITSFWLLIDFRFPISVSSQHINKLMKRKKNVQFSPSIHQQYIAFIRFTFKKISPYWDWNYSVILRLMKNQGHLKVCWLFVNISFQSSGPYLIFFYSYNLFSSYIVYSLPNEKNLKWN